MNGELINPYALYVYCDGSMDYDPRNTGGIGLEIKFPDSVEMETIKISIGKYEGANIERLELEAILQGMNEVIKIFQSNKDKLINVRTIIFKTDRFGLNDKEKTNPYRIKEWRKNKWHNHEGKAIKNCDLLEKVDKTRKKIIDKTFCSLEIQYGRRKFNKTADKLAKAGKKQTIIKDDITLSGTKIGKRKYCNNEVNYNLLVEKNEYVVHVYKKEPVRDQWEICVELNEGIFLGMVLKIYSDPETELKLHRHHVYKIRIKKVFAHHVTVYKIIKKVKYDKKK